MPLSKPLQITLVWLFVLCLFWLIYEAGLPGGFIFDDTSNLAGLKAIAHGRFPELLSFSLQGFAGPSGRPLSLLTFALQHASWPNDPAAFKRVNMLIHVMNATLLLWFFTRVRQLTGGEHRWVPLIAAALWLLWPIQISTVLYVVQRMTLLSASCMFLGLALYAEARTCQLRRGATRAAHGLLLAALCTGIALGILCKENAILFPLLVLVLEATLLRSLAPPPRSWKPLLWLPLIAFLAYLFLYNKPWSHYGSRNFDLAQRLLTEGRVLWMYVQQILLPSAGSLKFLYDNYPVSTGLLSPVSTALAWVTLIVVGVGAWIIRRRHSLIAFAVLFFLASHALESTLVPLELVFEHRNYLGSMAFAYALAAGLADAEQLRPRLRQAIGALYLVAVSLVTFNITTLWGHPLIQKKLWYEQNQDSARVHLLYAHQLIMDGYPAEGAHIVDAATSRFPHDIAFPLARMELACYYPELRPESTAATIAAAREDTDSALSAFTFLDRLTVAFSDGACPTYSAADLINLLRAAQTNPAFLGMLTDLILMEGIVYSAEGDTLHAREQLQRALARDPRPNILIQAASWEMSNHNLPAARSYINALHALKTSKPLRYLTVRDDVLLLEAQYRELAAQRPAASP